MSRAIPPMNSVRAFEAASRHGQFQEAAAELGVTPSALSYQIRQLEEHLGVALFVRANRHVSLSPRGQALAVEVQAAFQQMERAFDGFRQVEDDDTLVISCGPAFSAKWLAPRLHFFLEENPELDFRLSATTRLTDFAADGVDAAVRFGAGDYPGLYVEPLFEETSIPMISPSLFEQLGGVADEALFSRVKLIHDDSLGFLAPEGHWPRWLSAMGYGGVDPKRGSRFSHADHCIEAAVDGAGIVMGRLGFAFRDLKAGRLMTPFKQAVASFGGFYFCCPPAALDNDKVLRFKGWLRDEADDQADAIDAFVKDHGIERIDA
ncbi:transcriptional regulator GcvA [Pseudahrensia aquimaris]|uniref:Transcriptional regulator GcvA n=1 Tax=Pseudahrensia aquimaris TaxID=744461 RepID=A0ABW3FF79_9HYPH